MPWLAPALALIGLWAIAVAQPLLDLVARSPEFLVAHQAGPADVLLLATLLSLGPPVALALVVAAAGLAGSRAGRAALLAMVGALSGLVAVQAAKAAGVTSAAWLVPAWAAGGVAAATLYARAPLARAFVSWLSIAALAVPLIFAGQPSIRGLIGPGARSAAGPGVVRGPLAPVVMVVLDEVPLVSLLDSAGAIDARHYPHFAQLARDGIWFRNATTVSDYTRWSLPAIVTGRHPREHASPSAADHPDTLFTALGATHRLEVAEAVTRLCPAQLCQRPDTTPWQRMGMMASDLSVVYVHLVVPDELKGGLPPLTDDWANFGAVAAIRRRIAGRERQRRAAARRRDDDETVLVRDRTSAFREFVRGISADDPQPTFYFMHTMLPHTPHVLLPGGQLNGTQSRADALDVPRALPGRHKDPWPDDEWLVAQSYQRHLLQLGFADRALGELLARLKATGLYDRATIVVLSDHGSTFRPGLPRRDYTERSAAEVMRIPLIIKFADGLTTAGLQTVEAGGARVSDVNAQTVDVAPTVAHAAAIRLAWPTDGRSLLDGARGLPAAKVIYHDAARRTTTLDAAGPDMAAALEWKRRLFDRPDNPYRVPRTGAFDDLVGRRVADLPVQQSGGEVRVDYLAEFQDMDPSEDPVAFDIAGRFADARTRSATYVAVAINGVVRAVTRTWRSAPGAWLATPPMTAWRDGHNTLDVFVVTEGPRGPTLRRSVIRPGLAAPGGRRN